MSGEVRSGAKAGTDAERGTAPQRESGTALPDGRDVPDIRPRRFSPAGLARERIAAYWVKVLRSWRTAFDWTVVVYLVVPGLWIGGNLYAEFWREPPVWVTELPVALPSALLAFLAAALAAELRTFAEEGDGLFLRRNRAWTRTITRIGLAYTFAVKLLVAALVTAVTAPFYLEIAQWPVTVLLWHTAGLACGGYLFALLRDAAHRRWSGWRRRTAEFVLTVAWVALWGGLAHAAEARQSVWPVPVAGLALAGAALSARRLRAKGTFQHEVQTERAAYVAAIGWLLVDAPVTRALPRGRRPLLFRDGRPLLGGTAAPHRRLADLWLRSAIRRPETVRVYGSLLAIGLAALLRVPLWLAACVWAALGFLAVSWLHRLVVQWYAEPFLKLFPWREDQTKRSAETARLVAGAPMFLLWGVAVGVKTGLAFGGAGWLAVPAVPVAGWWLWRGINAWMGNFPAKPVAARRPRQDREEAEADCGGKTGRE